MSLPVVPSKRAGTQSVAEAGHTTSPDHHPPAIVTVTASHTFVAVTQDHTKLNEETVLVSVLPSSCTAMLALAEIVTFPLHTNELPFTVFMFVHETSVSCFPFKAD